MTRQPSKRPVQTERTSDTATPLLAWYDRHRRVLPWRAPPGVPADPYAVWLSEIMLQQTTVAAVKSYFTTFLALWPTVGDLAAAPIEDVMRRWAGLGYYSRARNLHSCARMIAARGSFPETEAELRELPGIGPYTAAAIASIAFGRKATVVDGNVERVIVRLHEIGTPIRDAKAEIKALAALRTPDARCGDYAQAMMDLGATICTPRSPACVICPIAAACGAWRAGRQGVLPVKAVRAQRPTRFGTVFYVRSAGKVLVRTRPEKGLLGGMTEFPGSSWTLEAETADSFRPLPLRYRRASAQVEHGFTHFELRLTVFAAEADGEAKAPSDCRWVGEARLEDEALPSLMRKVAAAAQDVLKISQPEECT